MPCWLPGIEVGRHGKFREERNPMRAIVWTHYGSPDSLQLQARAKPTPKDHEVLIRIVATTATAGDCELRRLQFPFLLRVPLRLYVGLKTPYRITVLGQELAGEIEAVGKNVTRFRVGDQVFATTGLGFGAYAEYIALPEAPKQGALALKPINMTYEEAAAIPVGGLEALYFLKKAQIQSGNKVLIYGAGGSIGTVAIQLARYFGAEVTGVDSTGKLAMLRSIGADQVIDYTQVDFTTRSQTYDVIYDVVGKSPFARSVRSIKPNGSYLVGNAGLSQMLRGLWTRATSRKNIMWGAAVHKTEDLLFLKALIEAGHLKTVIDRCYPLEQVAEAHRYVDEGLKKGNVVITVDPKNPSEPS